VCVCVKAALLEGAAPAVALGPTPPLQGLCLLWMRSLHPARPAPARTTHWRLGALPCAYGVASAHLEKVARVQQARVNLGGRPTFCLWSGHSAHLEQVARVQQARVNLGGRLVALAHHKDLRGRIARGSGLRGLHLGKQLVECVQQRVVVLCKRKPRTGGMHARTHGRACVCVCACWHACMHLRACMCWRANVVAQNTCTHVPGCARALHWSTSQDAHRRCTIPSTSQGAQPWCTGHHGADAELRRYDARRGIVARTPALWPCTHLGSEHLAHKRALGRKELGGQAQGVQHERGLQRRRGTEQRQHCAVGAQSVRGTSPAFVCVCVCVCVCVRVRTRTSAHVHVRICTCVCGLVVGVGVIVDVYVLVPACLLDRPIDRYAAAVSAILTTMLYLLSYHFLNFFPTNVMYYWVRSWLGL